MNSVRDFVSKILESIVVLLGTSITMCGQQLQHCSAQTPAFLFQADPTLFYYQGLYYLYGTDDIASNEGIKVFISSDRTKFRAAATHHNGFALEKRNAFGTSGFWAPQVWQEREKFYMAYVANEHIAIASANSPTGPFTSGNKPVISQKAIDPYVFRDDNGKKYLFHVAFSYGNRIFVAQLKDDYSEIVPGTDSICLSAQEPWETVMDRVVEGPTVLKHGKWYYLIYSANHFMSQHYAVGYATSKSILGPWGKSRENPVLGMESIGRPGSGHGDIFFDNKGKMFYIFHTHNTDSIVSPRKTAMVGMYFEKNPKGGPDKLKIDAKSVYYPLKTDN